MPASPCRARTRPAKPRPAKAMAHQVLDHCAHAEYPLRPRFIPQPGADRPADSKWRPTGNVEHPECIPVRLRHAQDDQLDLHQPRVCAQRSRRRRGSILSVHALDAEKSLTPRPPPGPAPPPGQKLMNLLLPRRNLIERRSTREALAVEPKLLFLYRLDGEEFRVQGSAVLAFMDNPPIVGRRTRAIKEPPVEWCAKGRARRVEGKNDRRLQTLDMFSLNAAFDCAPDADPPRLSQGCRFLSCALQWQSASH